MTLQLPTIADQDEISVFEECISILRERDVHLDRYAELLLIATIHAVWNGSAQLKNPPRHPGEKKMALVSAMREVLTSPHVSAYRESREQVPFTVLLVAITEALPMRPATTERTPGA